MAERSGFFNALKTSAGYDVKYNADDYSACLAAIIGNGVRRSGNNDLRVIASGGMALTISVGFAMIDGRWYWNDAIYTSFSVPTAPVGDLSRKDRIILRLDKSVSSRSIKLVYLQGSNSSNPTAPALTRDNTIYEISLATISVNPSVTTINQSDITDDRPDQELCGWITTPVGYDDFFANFDAEFNDWFVEKKNTLASVTLFKQYMQRITTESATKLIEFNIPQYDYTGVDILQVYVNGVFKVKGIHYNVTSATTLTFVDELNAKTDIDIVVYKSIDGTGLGSVSDEITELQNQMASIKNIGEYIYICNGVNDNIKLSDLAKELLTVATTNDNITINVYGKFGMSTPYSGYGTSVSRYRWFDFQPNASTSKKITFDFLNCSEIRITENDPTAHYIGFYGTDIHIKNLSIYVSGSASKRPASFNMFSSGGGYLFCENCRFYIFATYDAIIAKNGTFNDCYGEVISAQAAGTCFQSIGSNALIRLHGGEYRAYCSSGNTNNSYVVDCENGGAAVGYGVSMPTVSSSYGTQKYSIGNYEGNVAFYGTITELPSYKDPTTTGTHTISGTINLSKPNVND